MEIKWIRGREHISFNKAAVWFIQGTRDSGKSSFLEHLAMLYLEEGSTILDLFSSRDGESLGWLRSPYAKDKRILLLKSENCDVECSFPVKNATELTLGDFEKFDLIISASPLYLSMDDEFLNSALIVDKIYRRLSWTRLVYCAMREASNFLYSRLKLSEDQTEAKVQCIYTLREGRHNGLIFGLDSVRMYSIDIDIRSLVDYLILKAQGISGLSKDLRWVYRYFTPTSIQRMRRDVFAVLSRKGNIGRGVFPYHTWHKEERENILKAVGVKVEYGESTLKGEDRGTFKTIGDKEHANIIDLYLNEGLGMVKIGDKLGRSSASVQGQIKTHDKSIERSGFCPSCRRVKASYESEIAHRETP